MILLVTSEARLVIGPDGRTYSPTGVESHAFWRRYLAGFSEVLVATRARPSAGDGAELGAVVEGPGVRTVALPPNLGPWGYLRERGKVIAALRDAVAEVDALCVRAPGPIAACAWRLRGSRPLAVEVVGDPYDALATPAGRSVVRSLARHRLRRELAAMCRDAVAVGYVSGHLAAHYPAGSWSTTYSSIDLDDDAFVDGPAIAARNARLARPTIGRDDDPWRLLAIGSLAQPYKGFDVLIDALAALRARGTAAHLTLVGEGVLRGPLAARAAANGVAVDFSGRLAAGAAVRGALDASDLFVLPSRSEGLPRVLLEAMARGVVAVGTRVGGVPTLLPAERLAPPNDPAALAAVLGRVAGREIDLTAAAGRDRDAARAHHVRHLRPRRAALYGRLRDAVAAASSPTAPRLTSGEKRSRP